MSTTESLTRDQIKLDAQYQKALAALKADKTPAVFSSPKLDNINLGDFGAPGYKVIIKKGSSPIAGGTLNPGHYYATFYGGTGGIAVRDDITAHQAAGKLVDDLKNDYPKESKALDRALTILMEAWWDYKNTPRKAVREKKVSGNVPKMPPAIEKEYQQYRRLLGKKWKPRIDHDTDEILGRTTLGDDSYTKRFKMPKWSHPVSMLHNNEVAIKHANELGIPFSKDAHRQRSQHFAQKKIAYNKAWNALVDHATSEYGDGNGSLISGVYREHFPTQIKDRLRFLSHGEGMLGTASHLHHFISKTRSPRFK